MIEPSTSNHLKITPEEYNAFCVFLERATGIVLGTDKLYLVNSRLSNLLGDNNIGSLTDLIVKLQRPMENSLRESVIDAMTTNETNWFRDMHPYSILVDKIFPQYKDKPQIRIWSAACSTGQEPHTISMCVSEYGEKIGWSIFGNNVKILGTDIASSVLERAKSGEYNEIEMERGISKERRNRFFEQLNTGKIRLKNIERSRVVFQPFNLLSSFAILGKFDIIFCRNVLIYFSSEIKIDIITRFANVLNDGGYLFLGSAESMPSQCEQFKIVHCNPGIIYQKVYTH